MEELDWDYVYAMADNFIPYYKRLGMGFLEDLIDVTHEAESPTSYFYWSGLCAISAVVKNNLYLPKGGLYNLYPNIYTVLIGKSGIRKGYPVQLAQRLVRAVGNTKVISGRNSIQGVIKDLANTTTTPNGGPPNTDASVFLVSGELAAFLVEDPKAFTILTDLYDGHANPEWRSTLKSGTEILKNPCVTLLGASNQTHFKEALPQNTKSGGFIARTLIILEHRKRQINPLIDFSAQVNIDPLVNYLRILSTLKGEFSFSDTAKAYYKEWYHEFNSRLDQFDDVTGTADRLHDTALKVAMLLALSEKPEPIIELSTMERAIESCQAFTVSVNKVTMAHGEGSMAKATQFVMGDLLEAKDYRIDRQKILSKHYGDFDAADLDRVITNLYEAGAVGVDNSVRSKTVYFLKEKAIAALSELNARKAK